MRLRSNHIGEPAPAEPTPVEVQADDVPDRRGPSEWALPNGGYTPSPRPSEVPVEPEDHRQGETSPAEPERLGIHRSSRKRPKRNSIAARRMQRAPGHSTTAILRPRYRRQEGPAGRRAGNFRMVVARREGSGPPRTRKSVPALPGIMSTICSVLRTTAGRRMVRRATRTKTSSLAAPPAVPARPRPIAPRPSPAGSASNAWRSAGRSCFSSAPAATPTGRIERRAMPGSRAWSRRSCRAIPPRRRHRRHPVARPSRRTNRRTVGTEENTALSDAASTKFTQRLLADGTEKGRGTCRRDRDGRFFQEGKSVAARTHAVERRTPMPACNRRHGPDGLAGARPDRPARQRRSPRFPSPMARRCSSMKRGSAVLAGPRSPAPSPGRSRRSRQAAMPSRARHPGADHGSRSWPHGSDDHQAQCRSVLAGKPRDRIRFFAARELRGRRHRRRPARLDEANRAGPRRCR